MRHTALLFRACVAVVLMVLFFSLALSTSAALLYGGYELGAFTIGHVRGRGIILTLTIAAGMVIGGLVVLWSILPRIDRFTPPGPELSEQDQPQLFKEIRRVAAITGQRPPSHVYLVPDVNAFVTERGGWMGIGSRRVMGIGLGLLNLLTVSELRAVIAHEFGHFHGGDTKLGPWIYKTRSAVIRTVENLFKAGDATNQQDLGTIAFVLVAVRKPFEWFARLFLRITHAISRAQEYSADRMAVTTQGAKALVEGLKKVHRGGAVFDLFMRSEVGPLIDRKRQPPLGEGFSRFLASEGIASLVEDVEKRALEEDQADPYDTHPPLSERIRHAESLEAPGTTDDVRPATALLKDIASLESMLFSTWTEGEPLTPISWEQSAEAFRPSWREAQNKLAHALAAATPVTLPREVESLRRIASHVLDQDLTAVPAEQLKRFAESFYSSALLGMLVDQGFSARTGPGEAIVACRGDVTVAPFLVVSRYLKGELDEAAWRETWQQAGVADAAI